MRAAASAIPCRVSGVPTSVYKPCRTLRMIGKRLQCTVEAARHVTRCPTHCENFAKCDDGAMYAKASDQRIFGIVQCVVSIKPPHPLEAVAIRCGETEPERDRSHNFRGRCGELPPPHDASRARHAVRAR